MSRRREIVEVVMHVPVASVVIACQCQRLEQDRETVDCY